MPITSSHLGFETNSSQSLTNNHLEPSKTFQEAFTRETSIGVNNVCEIEGSFPKKSVSNFIHQERQGGQSMPVAQDIPFRTNAAGKTSDDTIKPQIAVMSSNNSSDSARPSDGSSLTKNPSDEKVIPEEFEEGIDEYEAETAPVPQFQYFHRKTPEISESNYRTLATSSENGPPTNRQITTNLHPRAQNSFQRPSSTYSDLGPVRNSPGARLSNSPHLATRSASNHSSHLSHDGRSLSFYDLANTSYPQAAPPPISLDNSQLRSVVGSNASLLTTAKTIEMYRQNVKKLNDSETQYAFAIYLIQAAQESGLNQDPMAGQKKKVSKNGERDQDNRNMEQELIQEAKHILQRLANQSYPFAQYYLADGYASGMFNKGKGDYSAAFPLFIAASKHGHAESGYRAALCYEFGWGCRKDPAKAVQFYRQSASKNHPGAMTRLGRAFLSGDLGLNKYREGVKWLKRATESADLQYNAAPYHLGLLYETGYGDDIFRDEAYAAQLFTQAADLGHSESCFRLGDAYEHGKLCCPRDPALSVHFYTTAAHAGHSGAMMALCAWYIVGAEPILEKDENEAYEWARQAAACGLAKAEYAVGYFTEMGIGTRRDPLEANVWYVKAAESGDERAKLRLAAIREAASGGAPTEAAPRNAAKIKKSQAAIDKRKQDDEISKDKDCLVM
ncbi:Protein SKT5 [Golovinomyces cichoracearum]|uniref:Protein SKT5 n=1 Tax=Golovinomyces cichoracearum TaxID=62708 RepID=A0A420IBZ7_9PEZI|nr:Protein SKT5 [Golovinomyces cichoracearum]